MRATVLLAIVLILNLGGHDRPGALAETVSTGGLHFTGTPSSTQEEQATPSLDSRTAPLPDLQGFPTASAPSELATVGLPDNVSAVTALFERLPPEVAGHTRSPQFDRIAPERSIVGYGENKRMRIARVGGPLLQIQAIDLTRGDFFPTNWKAEHVVAMMARHGEEIAEFGRDGSLFWVRQNTFMAEARSTERFPVYGMVWGRADSPWMFSVQADTRESRDALLAAFVAAAKSA